MADASRRPLWFMNVPESGNPPMRVPCRAQQREIERTSIELDSYAAVATSGSIAQEGEAGNCTERKKKAAKKKQELNK